ncbi:MAG: ABC transporter permease, partial [Aeromonas veronii]
MGVIYLVIFVIPLLAGLWQLLAEGMTASHLALLLAQPALWHSAVLSLWIGAASTLGSLLLTALLLAHSDIRAFGLL